MGAAHLFVVGIGSVPSIVGSIFQIGCSGCDGVVAGTVVACGIDKIDGCFAAVTQCQTLTVSCDGAIGLAEAHNGAKVDTLFCIASGMTSHGELSALTGFHLMRQLRTEGNTEVERSFLAGCQSDGNSAVGI